MNDKNIPSVILTGSNVDYNIMKWLGIDEVCVKEYITLILSKLGFNSQCMINIYEYSCDGYLYFKVNNVDYKMYISNNIENNCPVMSIDKDGYEFWYQIVTDNKSKVRLNMYKYKELIGNRCYTYELSNEWIEYTIEDGEYTLEFRVSKPIDLVSEYGEYKRYELKNQSELVKYLIGLEFNGSIFDMYKKLCELSLGNDVSKYSFVDLRLNRWVYDEDNTLEEKVTDLIYLENGELVSLTFTKDNKQVWYDKCNGDTSFVYNTDDAQVRFSICNRDSFSDVNAKLRFKSDNHTEEDVYKNMEAAKSEVYGINKLVRTMFGKNNVRK